jgi:hypothetical protein
MYISNVHLAEVVAALRRETWLALPPTKIFNKLPVTNVGLNATSFQEIKTAG